jgi:hypothetical protein
MDIGESAISAKYPLALGFHRTVLDGKRKETLFQWIDW